MGEGERHDEVRPSAVRRLRQARSIWIALVLSVIGIGVWIYAVMTAPAPVVASAVDTGGGTRSDLVSGLARSSGATGEAAVTAEPAKPRLVDRIAPTLVRLGPSFLAGFFLAWAIRRSLKLLLLIGGAAALLFFALQRLDLSDVNLSEEHVEALEESVKGGIEWAREQAGTWGDIARKAIPSGAAAAVGMFFGAQFR